MPIKSITFLLFCLSWNLSWGHAKFHKGQTQKWQGKVGGYVQIAITGSENTAGDFVVTAEILAVRNFEPAEFKWQLPDTAVVLSGDLNGTINLHSGGSQLLSLTLDRSSIQSQDQIFLFVQKKINGENHGASASFIIEEQQRVEALQKKSLKKKKFFQ